MLSRILRDLFFRFDINRGVTFEAASTPAAVRRIARRGIDVKTVIDIGASNGQWSEEIRPFFPDANYLLVEAQETHRTALDAYVRHNPKAQYVLKAAGANRGSLYFDATDAFAGQASTQPAAGHIEVPVTTIDAEVAERNLVGPYLLKFDVHGFEIPILDGAKQTLQNCSLIIMECYNFEIAPTALLFHDMCRHLYEWGFRVVDISEPLWRPSDHTLWQMDIFFVPMTRLEFQRNSYR
jgi:FkbM family methyltransferase